MASRDDDDALGQAPDATVTPDELQAREGLSRGWAVITGAIVVFIAIVLLVAWAIG